MLKTLKNTTANQQALVPNLFGGRYDGKIDGVTSQETIRQILSKNFSSFDTVSTETLKYKLANYKNYLRVVEENDKYKFLISCRVLLVTKILEHRTQRSQRSQAGLGLMNLKPTSSEQSADNIQYPAA